MTLTEKAFAARRLQAMLQHQHRVATEQHEREIQLQSQEAVGLQAKHGRHGIYRIKNRP